MRKSAFIMGGGSSLKPVLSDKKLLSRLNKQVLFGCNKAVDYFDCDYMVFFDPSFYDEYRKSIDGFSGDGGIFAPTSLMANDDRITLINTIGQPYKNGVYSGINSGTLATSLAINMGFKDIYLLGIDLISSKKKKSHFHKDYDWKKKKNDPAALGDLIYDIFAWDYMILGEWVYDNMLDVNLYSCGDISVLHQIDETRDFYQYKPLWEVLNELEG
jgi:hypothetical protein